MRIRLRWAILGALALAMVSGGVAWFARIWSPVRLIPFEHRLAAAPRQQPVVVADEPALVVAPVSVQDALLRPIDLPFAEPTALLDVQKYLSETLGLAVVLDLAAMDRLDVEPDDTIQLNLKGARLKTGLKLLLDQLGMTYRVEAEDNLLILTEPAQAGEPAEKALHELKVIHQEMHDLQDAVDDLRDLVEEDLGVEAESQPSKSLFVRSRTRAPHRRSRVHRASPAQPAPVPSAGVRG